MSKMNRRSFLKAGTAAGIVAAGGASALAAPVKKSATDWVTLGNSGVKVTRLAFGTGTFGGRVQRELGQEEFSKLVRYAYERGIRFFETADNYKEMPQMLATALKGIPRDTYKLMTKYRLRDTENQQETVDRLRKDLNSEYVDIMLLHCVRTTDWSEQHKKLRDGLSEAKAKKIILAHGASCHGLLPLRAFPDNKWLDVALMRVNHDGTKMDTLKMIDTNDVGDVNEVAGHIKKIHAQGTGVLGMKIMGEGQFKTPEQRDASIKYVMQLGTVNAVTIGFKSPAEIDEAIERIGRHLNA
ncbi:MAG: aldo/keto reductase [Candidatus Solibacter usitatus]|nr:aldo/keto reductase [Candidatus Solibacter usitatus]